MTEQLSEHISVDLTQMAKVLATIVTDKYQWVEARKQQQPLESFLNKLSHSDRSFYDALATGKTAFILECKKASPSKGLIRENFDLDYIASVYAQYASAISVLTDEKYFQGNFDFLPQIRNQVTQPVLCKDFMVDSYQVYLARHYGADAILLMLSVLDDTQYRELAHIAHTLNMGVLTEVSNEAELERAISLEARVIGINNRNLRDLSTDLNRTKQLAPLLPQNVTIISESGIYNHQQVKDLSRYANGFLIGSSIMAEDDIEQAARRVILGENKVCGLTRPEDALNAYRAGAIFGGLIFVPHSKRCIDIETSKKITTAAPLNFVGVFQNQSIELIVATARELPLAAVQLHGEESQDYINRLRSQLPKSVAIWKAYGVSDTMPSLLSEHVDRHLLDSRVGTQSGGTGHTFDWSLLGNTTNIMLAGGITPSNIKQAAALGCIGLDLNSGVESAPGIKDPHKLIAAFTALRDY
jgi:indole-3-glycerol phosphate synthase / phosphoribosylanthranilate isomerase